jgi:CDP-Glycerol:Poly(glycerophosphate) glycerophosphotransferase
VPRPIVVDFLAGEPHFADHTLPVYMALPPEMRGAFITRPGFRKPQPVERSPRAGLGDMILTPSWGDLARSRYTKRPVVFMEHGAGFRFRGHSYCGSPDRPNVALFLCQSGIVEAANRVAHPHTASAVVGVPKMDRWHAYDKPANPRPIVAFAFHWDCQVTPGTRSAWEHYKDSLPELKRIADLNGWDLVGHSHPRIATRVRTACRVSGIPFLETLDEVFASADMLIADATSAAYEFASLDRPVLNLNAPWYHDEPVLGIRFPYYMPGIVCERPEDLAELAVYALTDPPKLARTRRDAIDAVYPVRGNSAEHAATAIQDFVRSC